MDNELIDRIHECAFAPESWPSVIGDLSRKVDAVGGALFIFGPERTCWTTTPGSEQLVGSMVDEGWMRRGKFLQRAQAMRHPGFLREYDVFSPEELDEEPLWRDWFRPRGLGWGAGTTVPLPTGECVYLALNRSFRRGPVETEFIQEVDVYRPHLARAIVVSARLQLERARAASETLALLGLPGLVLNDGGRVMAANALCEQRKDLLIWRAQDRVALTDGAASALLNQSIAAMRAGRRRSYAILPCARRFGASRLHRSPHSRPPFCARHFRAMRRRADPNPDRRAERADGRTAAIPLRPDASGKSGGATSRLGRQYRRYFGRQRRLAQHDSRAASGRDGQDRLRPSGRGRGAARGSADLALAALVVSLSPNGRCGC